VVRGGSPGGLQAVSEEKYLFFNHNLKKNSLD
jgi:hypothetical protein